MDGGLRLCEFVVRVIAHGMSTQTVGVALVGRWRGGVKGVVGDDMCTQNGPAPCGFCVCGTENGLVSVWHSVHCESRAAFEV
jgi:hypothetical protein